MIQDLGQCEVCERPVADGEQALGIPWLMHAEGCAMVLGPDYFEDPDEQASPRSELDAGRP